MDIKPNLQTSAVIYVVATVTALTSVFPLAGDNSTNTLNWKRKERRKGTVVKYAQLTEIEEGSDQVARPPGGFTPMDWLQLTVLSAKEQM
jgi:hypothetical protein